MSSRYRSNRNFFAMAINYADEKSVKRGDTRVCFTEISRDDNKKEKNHKEPSCC